ncbi:MAG: hypothetical protein ACI4E4_07360 [Acetatifactor sp.]
MKTIRQLKIELFSAIVAVFIAVLALVSSTFAWYVSNSKVDADTSTISAMTNGFVLQIADAESGRPEGSGGTLTHVFTEGGILSPSSSDDMKTWYVPQSWNTQGLINGYTTPTFDGGNAAPGQYTIDDVKYFAYIRSDYLVYTVSETGYANVYLENGGSDAPPIKITKHNGDGESTFTGSLRVAITTETYNPSTRKGMNDETLRLVYALENETGKGNDATAKSGWTSIQKDGSSVKLDTVTYPYVYAGNYVDQLNGKNWAATKSGDDYVVPANSQAIAEHVGYDGTLIHVYIWLEGTDADCVNGKAIDNDSTTYDVTVNLAGVATGS